MLKRNFRKFGPQIDAPGYRQWREQHHYPPLSHESVEVKAEQQLEPNIESVKPLLQIVAPNDPGAEAAPYPSSFNHIVELITSGAPIPGIKEIPDTILEGQASEPTKLVRQKPWEMAPTDDGKGKKA